MVQLYLSSVNLVSIFKTRFNFLCKLDMMTDNILPPRKYFSECSVSLFTAGWGVLPPDQLHADVEPNENTKFLETCHIYLICRRPSLSIDPNTFHVTPEYFEGHILYRVAGIQKRLEFKFSYHMVEGITYKVDVYPHKRIISVNQAGETIDPYWFIDQLLISGVSDMDIRRHEVLYVGQAFGEGGERGALDRLRSHSTLQKIFADMQANAPDDEARIFAFEYLDYQLITFMDGIGKDAEFNGEEDLEHFRDIIKNPLTKKEQISLAEAGLIRYFQPKYNVIYKKSFPELEQKILGSLYTLDFAALVVEINTEELYLPIYSTSVKDGVHHIAKYDLHDANQRRSFFSILDQDGQYALMKGSGPIY